MRIAINGMGRIGRAALKIILEHFQLELVAVNDLAPLETIIYLLRYDTVYGRYGGNITGAQNRLVINGREYECFREENPAKLPWRDLEVDIVFECTGRFTTRPDLEKHQAAGARGVFLSAPAADPDIPTVVHGVNIPNPDGGIISCGSCTTNCITPIIEILGRRIGLQKALMNAMHAYTATQALVDTARSRLRRGRAAATNLVPTTTGAAIAATRVLPEYEGRFNGMAFRAPVPAGSAADMVLHTLKDTSARAVNAILEEEAETDRYRGVLAVSNDPLVSSDIIGNPHAAVVDLELTQVVGGDLVRVVAWYDNEWGYANQMVREALQVALNGGIL